MHISCNPIPMQDIYSKETKPYVNINSSRQVFIDALFRISEN